MDRKTIPIVIACIVMIYLLGLLSNKIYPPIPIPKSANTNVVASAAATNVSTQTATNAPPGTVAAALNVPQRKIEYHGEEQTLVVTNENARYTFTSHGGGLKLIELVQFPERPRRHKKNAPLTNGVASLNTRVALPVLDVVGDDSVQDDAPFKLTQTTNAVQAEKTLTNGVRLVKEFQLGTNYLVHATVRLENTSDKIRVLSAQEWVIGTATPMDPDDKGDAEGLMWYDGKSTVEQTKAWFDNPSFFSCIGVSANQPRLEYRAGSSNVVWAAAHNQFFALVAMPSSPAQQVVARTLELPRPSEGWYSNTNNPTPKGYQTALVYPESPLAPGQLLERKITFYAGPKEYRTLARLAERFQNNVDLVMGFGSFLGMSFFAKALLLIMNWVHNVASIPYGWVIIVITVALKVIFWPLTAASTRSAKRMQALAPQVNALKEKYKDDPQKFSQKQWELWKKNKVSPVSGCLPMLVQLPVFFGLYSMLRTAIELRGAGFLWIADLSKPDTLFVIPGLTFIPFNISTPEGLPINLLPIIYITTAIWQTHLTPASPGMDPSQQKLMRWMPLMFLAILYNFSSGLALYMTINNLLTILQTKMTKMTDAAGPATAQPTVLTPTSKKKK